MRDARGAPGNACGAAPAARSPLYSIPHLSFTMTCFPVRSVRNGLGFTGTVCAGRAGRGISADLAGTSGLNRLKRSISAREPHRRHRGQSTQCPPREMLAALSLFEGLRSSEGRERLALL